MAQIKTPLCAICIKWRGKDLLENTFRLQENKPQNKLSNPRWKKVKIHFVKISVFGSKWSIFQSWMTKFGSKLWFSIQKIKDFTFFIRKLETFNFFHRKLNFLFFDSKPWIFYFLIRKLEISIFSRTKLETFNFCFKKLEFLFFYSKSWIFLFGSKSSNFHFQKFQFWVPKFRFFRIQIFTKNLTVRNSGSIRKSA